MPNEPKPLFIKCDNCGAVFYSKLTLVPNCSIQESWFNCDFCHHSVLLNGVGSQLAAEQTGAQSPRDLGFADADPYRDLLLDLMESLRNLALRRPANSFTTNIMRLQAMLELPLSGTWTTHMIGRFSCQAQIELT